MSKLQNRKTLPKKPKPAEPDADDDEITVRVKEDFGENTYAGAFDAVKAVLAGVDGGQKKKPKKK